MWGSPFNQPVVQTPTGSPAPAVVPGSAASTVVSSGGRGDQRVPGTPGSANRPLGAAGPAGVATPGTPVRPGARRGARRELFGVRPQGPGLVIRTPPGRLARQAAAGGGYLARQHQRLMANFPAAGLLEGGVSPGPEYQQILDRQGEAGNSPVQAPEGPAPAAPRSPVQGR